MIASPDIVDEIYEAAAIPERWPEVLAHLSDSVGVWGAGLLVFDQQQRMRFTATPNYIGVFESFAATGDAGRYDNKRPKRAIASGYAGFQHDLELFTQAELDIDPVYCDFIYPYGVRWTAGTVVPVPTSDILTLDVSRRDEPFARSDMEHLDLYRPHLARAALLAHRLGMRAARSTTEALEVLGLPAAVLQQNRRVLAANGLLQSMSSLFTIGGFDHLRLRSAMADALFSSALTDAALTSVRSIPVPATEEDTAVVIHLVPLRRSAHDVFSRGDVLLLATPVTVPTAPMSELLTGLFDLTPAEARVARGVSVGETVDDLAKARGLSRETVRAQLKAVMLKTGTRRQAELALLLSGIRSPNSPTTREC